MPLPPWTKRDCFSTPSHQRIVDAVNEFAFQTATGDLDTVSTPGGHVVADRKPLIIDEILFGKITSTGPRSEADFTDNRYWVKKQKVLTPTPTTSATTLADDPWPIGDMTTDASGNTVATSTVMATYGGAGTSHNLSAGTIVLLIAFYPFNGINGARDKRYLLVPLAIGIDLWNDTTQVATNAASISLNPALGTPNVLQWTGTAPSGARAPVGVLSIKPGTNRTALQIDDSGNAVWLPFIFWA